MKVKGERRKSRSISGFLVVPMLVSGPMIVLFAGFFSDESPASLPVLVPAAVYAPVENAEISIPIEVTLTWSAERKLAYSGGPGTVTALNVGVGTELVNGTELISVDGHRVRAMVSEAPIVTPIGPKSPKKELISLNAFLASTGYDVASDSDRWTKRTQKALRTYLVDHGWPTQEEFDPAIVVWSPSDISFCVAGGLPSVGFPAPAAGEPFAIGTPALASASVPVGGVDLSGGTITVGDSTFAVGMDSNIAGADLVSLQGKLAPGAETVTASGSPPTHRELVAIPPSSVVATAEGQLCAQLEGASGAPGKVVRVLVVGGVPGISYIEKMLEMEGTRILVNPVEVGARLSC